MLEARTPARVSLPESLTMEGRIMTEKEMRDTITRRQMLGRGAWRVGSSGKLDYAIKRIMTECDDWRTLDAGEIRALAGEAFDAWQGGAR